MAESSPMRWNTGETGYIDGRHIAAHPGVPYQATILDWAFSAEGNYLQLKLKITHTVKGFDGQEQTHVWVYPKPVQSYKLRRSPWEHEKRTQGKK